MDNKRNEIIKRFECRHCASMDKISAVKEKYDNLAVVEIFCLECREKETVVI